MKKIIVLFLIGIFMIISLSGIVYSQEEIKDFNTLIIYIKNQEFDKKNVFQKDGEIYTSIVSLAKVVTFSHNYEKDEAILYVNGKEFTGGYYAKGHIIYVAFEDICEFLGYTVSYNEAANILDITSKAVYSGTAQNTTSNNNYYTNTTTNTSGGSKGTIIPGYGIEGVAQLGCTMNDVKRVWGEPLGALNLGTANNDKMYIYEEVGFIPDTTDTVIGIMVITNTYQTREGVRIGSTFEEVKSIYGNQYITTGGDTGGGALAILYTNGISFEINNQTQLVQAIGVFSVQ